MTRLLDDKDQGMHKVNTLGGAQNLLIVSEFGILMQYSIAKRKKQRILKDGYSIL